MAIGLPLTWGWLGGVLSGLLLWCWWAWFVAYCLLKEDLAFFTCQEMCFGARVWFRLDRGLGHRKFPISARIHIQTSGVKKDIDQLWLICWGRKGWQTMGGPGAEGAEHDSEG